jgi:hypothetical protein
MVQSFRILHFRNLNQWGVIADGQEPLIFLSLGMAVGCWSLEHGYDGCLSSRMDFAVKIEELYVQVFPYLKHLVALCFYFAINWN